MNIEGMTEEQKRRRIAEACGWSRFTVFQVGGVDVQYGHHPRFTTKYEAPIPDYLNDLNAMHEGEQILDYDMRLDYMSNLIDVVGRNQPNESFSCITATARQRADAFLLTLPEPEQEAK